MKNFPLLHLITLLIFSCASTSIFATHLVGGDFKITMTNNGASSSNYDIQLRLYRDDVNGLVNMPSTVTIGIYQIGTNILQTTKVLYLDNNSGSIVPLGDACFSPNPAVIRVEEGVYNGLTSTVLPNFSMGYYIQYQTCCRNASVTNLADPDSDGISIFAIIPDPAFGQNSSPDFGNYPNDAYFCLNSTNSFIWPVTDPDGDSLVFSLVQPLNDGNGATNGNSTAGTGAYPFYPTCIYAAGYSLTSLGPGTPPMTINSVTGEIFGSPAIIGNFVFAVRVEEYRNGVKIGEVRRDVQYAVEPLCTTVTPPFISINNDVDSSGISSDTLSILINVKDSLCFDLEFGVSQNGIINDTSKMYLKLTSNNFDLTGSYVQPNADTVSIGANNTYLSYYNWENISNDTVFFNLDTNNTGVDSGYIEFTGYGYFRYCWQAPCESFGSTFNILVDAYSKDCSGINQSQKNVTITVDGPTQALGLKGNLTRVYQFNDTTDTTLLVGPVITSELFQETCLDVLAIDDSNFIDTLFLEAMSIDFLNILYADSVFDPFSGDSIASKETAFLDSFFDFEAIYQPPSYNNGTEKYYYENFNNSIDTFSMNGFSHVNNISSAVQSVGMRFCFTSECRFIKIRDSIQDSRNYQLNYKTFSTICSSDTLFGNTKIYIDRPEGEEKDIPNVFTPNGDLVNDVFKLDNLRDTCFDFMSVRIYNRWGQLVFEDDDPYFKWDGNLKNGKECKSGSYLIIISGEFGSKYDSEGRREGIAVKDEFWIQLLR
jgi:gliding motility-associated-like protein